MRLWLQIVRQCLGYRSSLSCQLCLSLRCVGQQGACPAQSAVVQRFNKGATDAEAPSGLQTAKQGIHTRGITAVGELFHGMLQLLGPPCGLPPGAPIRAQTPQQGRKYLL